jgi:hypothetical protein
MQLTKKSLKKQLKKQLKNFLIHIETYPDDLWIEPITMDGRQDLIRKVLSELGASRSQLEAAMWEYEGQKIVLSFKLCFKTGSLDFTRACFYYNNKQ